MIKIDNYINRQKINEFDKIPPLNYNEFILIEYGVINEWIKTKRSERRNKKKTN
jgi:hypothetical protein